MIEVKERLWTSDDHETWYRLFERLESCRQQQAHPTFSDGVNSLGLTSDGIPVLRQVNVRLKAATGWQGVFVEGLVDGRVFLLELANRKFPIGNFIRNKSDLNYTPAPDIFHDLYGHLPFLANKAYADFCEQLGKLAIKYSDSDLAIRMCERLFWFGVEFSLIETERGRRIFGGGILSSFSESNYSLSSEPEVIPFSLNDMVNRDYNINEMQKRIYLLTTPNQLYDCLTELETFLKEAV